MSKTGRAVTYRKLAVHEAYGFDILAIQRDRLLFPGATGMTNWRVHAGDTWGVRYFVDGDGGVPTHIRFDCPMFVPGGSRKVRDEWYVDLESTPCNFGRLRYWFVCPVGVDDSGYGHRCRILYFVPGSNFPGCRKCHDLTYESRRRHREQFYEEIEKHQQTLAKLKTFKPPRSPKQWIRRFNRRMAANQGELAGLRAMSARPL